MTSMFTTRTPHFFKVVLSEALTDGKLGIPENFIRKYASQLPRQVHLEVPSGAIWEVELAKSDGRLWLQKGWQEFAEQCSIKPGHFLVFRYESNAHFHVLIFDMTAAEVDYPIEQEDDDDIIILDNISICKKNKRKSAVIPSQPGKEMKVDFPSETGTSMKSNIAGSARVKHQISQKTEILKGVECLSKAEKDKAVKKARGFKSSNPFFMVVIQPSFVSSLCRMTVPTRFARKYLTLLQRTGNVILSLPPTGQTWHASYNYFARSTPILYWKGFAVDNAVKVGDVCVFELMKRSPEFLFKVVIINYPNGER